MITPTKRNPRGAGRKPSGLPPRVRRNLNIQRDKDFDENLFTAQRRIAEIRGVGINTITQTEAVKLAVRFYTEVITINELPKCPRCNDTGIIAILNGDDDETCECCGQHIDASEIPF